MGHVKLDIELIDLYLKKMAFSILIRLKHLKNNSAHILNILNYKIKIKFTQSTLHHKMYAVIQQHNFLNNYMFNKNTISFK